MALNKLASSCEYGTKAEERVRDIFVIGYANDQHQQELVKLCDKISLSFAEVVKLAVYLATTGKRNESTPKFFKVESDKTTLTKREQKTIFLSRKIDCLRFGTARYKSNSDCTASNVECLFCRRYGHF
ncbi:hypothetical protein RF11_11554 [Thelohanellus kitauei]|uniref:Uncharacterized protein n=1 Tax=Thelohanellus kitauei TaxID=669202 RepID=A0A0C2ITI7_THEKT|nr:hypothetical protein RF11_11554 [Thelohanellus kitauei]